MSWVFHLDFHIINLVCKMKSFGNLKSCFDQAKLTAKGLLY